MSLWPSRWTHLQHHNLWELAEDHEIFKYVQTLSGKCVSGERDSLVRKELAGTRRGIDTGNFRQGSWASTTGTSDQPVLRASTTKKGLNRTCVAPRSTPIFI